MYDTCMIALKVVFYIVTAYYLFCGLYVFIFSVSGLFYKNPVFGKAGKHRKIAVLVPAYKADMVIEDLVDNVLLQEYPNFDLIVIADSLSDEVMQRLKKKPIKLMPFCDENRTKALALNTIMSQLPDDYAIALILDADNLIPDRDYLNRLNDIFESGAQAVQTHRSAKNTNTVLAFLDEVSEEINHQIFRRGHAALSLSSALAGSAMAFDYRLYREQMKGISSSGEDKDLEMKLLLMRIPIIYHDGMIVLDEKTQHAGSFIHQRARWIASQLRQVRNNSGKLFKHFFNGNINFIDKVLQHFTLPRLLLIASVFVFSVLAMIFLSGAYRYVWMFVIVVTYSGILVGIPKRLYTIELLKSVFYLPKAVVLMILSLFSIKGATKKFVATEHVAIPDDKLLYK